MAVLKDQIAQARQESIALYEKLAVSSYRESIREATSMEDYDTVGTFELLAYDEAEEIAKKHGVEAVKVFFDEATALTPILAEISHGWVNV